MNDDRYHHPVYKTWRWLIEKEEAVGFPHLPAAEQVFWRVYLLDLEVWNGYFEWSRAYCDDAEDVYPLLQAWCEHKLVDVAVGMHPGS